MIVTSFTTTHRTTRLTVRGILLAFFCAGLGVGGALLGATAFTALCITVLLLIVALLVFQHVSPAPGFNRLIIEPHPVAVGSSFAIGTRFTNYVDSWRVTVKLDPRLIEPVEFSMKQTHTHVYPQRRGVFALGSVTVCRHDVFGFSSTTTTWNLPGNLVVQPRIYDLELPHLGSGSELMNMARSNTSYDDVLLREYVAGDEMRRVHWSASARAGELMVRAESSGEARTLTIIADIRPTCEDVISAACSLGIAAVTAGWRVRVLASDASPVMTSATEVLDYFTYCEPDPHQNLTEVVAEHGDASLTLGFFQDIDQHTHGALSEINQLVGAVIFAPNDTPHVDTQNGVRVAHAPDSDGLQLIWSEFFGADS